MSPPEASEFKRLGKGTVAHKRDKNSLESVAKDTAETDSPGRGKMAPNFYLDTNIIFDETRHRKINNLRWIPKIKEKKWRCFTSVFALMEMIDSEQAEAFVSEKRRENIEYNTICRDRSQINLAKNQLVSVGNRFKMAWEQYAFIRTVALTEDGWRLARRISENSNVFAPDVIHLASALQCKSNILLTRDAHFRDHGNDVLESEDLGAGLKICDPNHAQNALADMGFDV